MSIFPACPFGNHSRNCIACGRDPGLKHWRDQGDLLCWRCWPRVEHLGDIHRSVVFDACRLFRAGQVEMWSAAENDLLVALGTIEEWM